MKDRLANLVLNKYCYLHISAILLTILTAIIGCHSTKASKQLLYNFDFMYQNEHYALFIDISFNKEGYYYPGTGFSTTPSGSTVNISYKKYGNEQMACNYRLALTSEQTMDLIYIIGESEIFSLPVIQHGLESFTGVGGSCATFSRTYNGKTITIKRIDGWSLPVKSLIAALHDFIQSIQK